jgi:Protein of unknown function (DUF4238)
VRRVRRADFLTIENSFSPHPRWRGSKPGVSTYRAVQICGATSVVLSPLASTEHRPLGYGSLHTHVLFPLSRTAALVMNGDKGRIRHADVRPEQVERFNSAVAADCYRYVIGSNADLLNRTTAPLNLAETRWAPRVDVGIGIPPGEELPAVFIRGLSKRPTAPA